MTLRERIDRQTAVRLAVAERDARAVANLAGRPSPVQSPMVDRAQSTARGTAWHAVMPCTADNVR